MSEPLFAKETKNAGDNPITKHN